MGRTSVRAKGQGGGGDVVRAERWRLMRPIPVYPFACKQVSWFAWKPYCILACIVVAWMWLEFQCAEGADDEDYCGGKSEGRRR